MNRYWTPISIGVLTLVLLFGIIRGCGSTGSRSHDGDTVQSRVLKSGTIRAAYIPYPPAVIKDPNTGELSGIFVDSLRRIASSQGLKVEFVAEEAWGSFAEGLRDDRYDIVCANIWPTASRSKTMSFSRPVYYSGVGVWVRPDDRRFDKDISLLNSPDVRVATIDGEINELIAKSRFPKAKLQSLPQTSDFAEMLLNVKTGKADVTFIEPYTAQAFLKNNPGAVRNVRSETPLSVYPNTFPMKSGEHTFKAMIDTSLDEFVNFGEVDELIKKYVPEKGLLYPNAYPYRSEERLAK